MKVWRIFLRQEILHLGHIADGNLHVIVPIPNGDSAIAHEIERRIFHLLSERRGSVSAEHGVGMLKRPWLDRTRSPEELELMRLLQGSLDLKAILNPGRVITTDYFA